MWVVAGTPFTPGLSYGFVWNKTASVVIIMGPYTCYSSTQFTLKISIEFRVQLQSRVQSSPVQKLHLELLSLATLLQWIM